MRIDANALGSLLIEACDTLVAPRFQALTDDQVTEKAPGEIVTIADREAETFITSRLHALVPGVPVVGEEAVAENPSLLHALTEAEWCWLLDPLDGTSNFAKGDPHWAIELALVHNGETVLSLMYRHLDQMLYTAERGEGAWRNGERMQVADRASSEIGDLRGAVLDRFLTDDERAVMTPQFPGFAEILPGFMCTGFEYPAVAEGSEDFALFQRLLPWDHAPGSLLLTEAGGVSSNPDGTSFRPDHVDRRGLLLAATPEIWTAVRDTLYPSLAGNG